MLLNLSRKQGERMNSVESAAEIPAFIEFFNVSCFELNPLLCTEELGTNGGAQPYVAGPHQHR